MDELILRKLSGDASPEDEALLSAWLEASPENRRRYRRRLRLWDVLALAARDGARTVPPTAEELVGRAPGGGTAERRRPGVGRIASRAAAVAVLLGAGAALWLARGQDAARFGAAEFVTGADEVATVRLDDGSIVRLGASTRLRFDNGASAQRRVWLDGTAFFAVAHEAGRPFIVHAGSAQARVLGTRFEIRSVAEELRVVVVEGRVALEANGGRVEIGPSQVSHVLGPEPPTVLDVADVSALLPWSDGQFTFQDTPLAQVAQELGRYYGVPIHVTDPELATRGVTAWLREQSLDAALTTVCRAVGARCTIHEFGVTIASPARGGAPR